MKHEGDDEELHQRLCQSGLARCAIGSGDLRRGIQLAHKLGQPQLMKQCAALLEENKVPPDLDLGCHHVR